MMRDRGGGGGGDQLNMKPQEAQHGLHPPLPLIDRRLKEAPHHHHNNNNHHHQQHHNHHQHHQQPQQQQQQIHNTTPGNDHQQVLKCPRCDSINTKFCYYNNYSLLQPRHFCKNCRRYWTKGGALRNVPVGGGCRKNNKRTNTNSSNNNNNNRQKGSAPSSFSSSSSTSVAELPPLSSNSQLVPLNTGISAPPHEGGPLNLPESLPPTPLFFNFPSPGGDDMGFPLFTPPSPALIHQQLIRLTPPHDAAMAGSLMGTTIPASPPVTATSSHLATLASLNNQLANFGALSLRNGFIGLADFGGVIRPPLLQQYGEGGMASGPMPPSEVDPFLNEAATATHPHQLAAVCSLPLSPVPTSSQMQAMAPGSDQQQDVMTNGSFSPAIAAANLQGGHWKAVQQIEQKLANKQQQPQHAGAETGEESQIITIERLNNQATIEGQDQGLLEAGGNNYWTSSGPPSWQDLPTGYAATPSTGPLL